MLKQIGIVFACIAVVVVAHANDLASWRDLKARYTIFSGIPLSDRVAPTANDRKLSILIDGQAAQEIFDSLGPDVPSCSQREGDRARAKEGVQCTYTAYPTPRGYRCWISVDLRSGKSIPALSC